MKRKDCVFYHCEHQMGASIDCCTLEKELGNCPCQLDCKKYANKNYVLKLGLNELQKGVNNKKGKWVMKEDPYGFFGEIPVCSECGCTNTMREKYTYCPHCGAYMRDEIGEFNEKGIFAQLFDE